VSLPNESLEAASVLVPEPWDQEDVVERQRESSGHAPRAGVGEVSGDGDSHRKDGGCSFAVAMFAKIMN
jgi:hypothetical protein